MAEQVGSVTNRFLKPYGDIQLDEDLKGFLDNMHVLNTRHLNESHSFLPLVEGENGQMIVGEMGSHVFPVIQQNIAASQFEGRFYHARAQPVIQVAKEERTGLGKGYKEKAAKL